MELPIERVRERVRQREKRREEIRIEYEVTCMKLVLGTITLVQATSSHLNPTRGSGLIKMLSAAGSNLAHC